MGSVYGMCVWDVCMGGLLKDVWLVVGVARAFGGHASKLIFSNLIKNERSKSLTPLSLDVGGQVIRFWLD